MSLIIRLARLPGRFRALLGAPQMIARTETRLAGDIGELNLQVSNRLLAQDEKIGDCVRLLTKLEALVSSGRLAAPFAGGAFELAAQPIVTPLSLAQAKWIVRTFPVRQGAALAGHQALRREAVRLLSELKDDDIFITTTFGLMMRLRPHSDVVTSRALLTDSVYEQNISEVIAHLLKPGDVALDVGANVGAHSLRAALAVGPDGQVLAFEPNPVVRARLQEHLDINGIGNVEIVPHAIGEETGAFKLLVSSRHAGSGTIMVPGQITDDYLALYARGNAESVNVWKLDLPGENVIDPASVSAPEVYDVEVRTLNQVISSDLEERVALIKIDVEGNEHSVLRSADFLTRNKNRPAFIVEYEERPYVGGRREDIYSFFHERDYSMYLVWYDAENESLTFNQISQSAINSAFENLVAIPNEKVAGLLQGCSVLPYRH